MERYLRWLLRMKNYEIEDLWKEIERLEKEVEELKANKKDDVAIRDAIEVQK